MQNPGLAERKFCGAGVGVGEVAAPAAGDADLLPRRGGVIEHQHRAPPLARLDGAHHAGRAGADDDHVEPVHHHLTPPRGLRVRLRKTPDDRTFGHFPGFGRTALGEATDGGKHDHPAHYAFICAKGDKFVLFAASVRSKETPMAWTRRYDEPEPQRVNRWLAQRGVCSRREAEAMITHGLVSIDGEVVSDAGRKIEPGQTLVLADQAEAALQSALTVMIHKPIGIVSAQPEPGQVPAIRLLTREALVGESPLIPDMDTSLAPVGRLDMDSRGLLILSEDGVVAKAVIGPESDLDKEYLVTVEGEVSEDKLRRLRHGLALDGRQLKPAKVMVTGDGVLRFRLKEGRNRQIRRMCDLVELEVVDLFRVRIGPLSLGDLPEGCWRVLTPEERAALFYSSKR